MFMREKKRKVSLQQRVYVIPGLTGPQLRHMYMLESFNPVVGRIYRKIGKILDSKVPLLLRGENGTGKEVLAHVIHKSGRQRSGRFWVVQCQAASEEQLECELFGHDEAGRPDQCDCDKSGQADYGIVFLKNIEALSLNLQLRLLRTMQERTRRGPIRLPARELCVRLIASTTKDLCAEVAKGNFRQDLYYRLSTYEHELPPLRERREDLPQFVRHFSHRVALEIGARPLSFTPAALSQLAGYDWPGNTGELKQVVSSSILSSARASGIVDQIHWAKGINGTPRLIDREWRKLPANVAVMPETLVKNGTHKHTVQPSVL